MVLKQSSELACSSAHNTKGPESAIAHRDREPPDSRGNTKEMIQICWARTEGCC
jgi:hypothetical protein